MKLPVFPILPICHLALAPTATAVTILHTVDPQEYRDEALLYPSVGKTSGSGLGGSGVLISDRWVLTAGHIAIGKTGGTFAVGGTNYTVESTIIHPGYSFGSNSFDLGLMYLSTAVTGVAPATMYHFGSVDAILGEEATWVGHGLSGTGLTGAQTPFEFRAFTNVIDVLGPTYGLTETAFIADFDHPDGSTNAPHSSPDATRLEGNLASGDSGGGVFVNVDGVAYLVGINSFTGGFEPGMNSRYGSISGASHLEFFHAWIHDETGIAAIPEPTVAGLCGLALVLAWRRKRIED